MSARTTRLLAGSVVATSMLIGSQAFALPSVTAAFVPGSQDWSDDSGEIITTSTGGVPVGDLTKGDLVFGDFGITSFPSSGVPATSVNQLTGIFALEISKVTATTAGRADFVFKPVADFNVAWGLIGIGPFVDTAGNPVNSTNDPGAAFLIFENTTHNFTRKTATFADTIATADAISPPKMVWTIADGDITATVPLDPTTIFTNFCPVGLQTRACTVGENIGGFGGIVTISQQTFPGWKFDPTVAVVGNNSRADNGPGSTNTEPGIEVRDDSTFTLFAEPTPEPATLALVGLGLLGLGAVRRRS